MKTANQLTFTTYEASLRLNPNDPIKVVFDNIDWFFIHPLVKERYKLSPQGAIGYDPISLFKVQLLIYLGEVSSDRKLASALRYNARLCLLCGFNFPLCNLIHCINMIYPFATVHIPLMYCVYSNVTRPSFRFRFNSLSNSGYNGFRFGKSSGYAPISITPS